MSCTYPTRCGRPAPVWHRALCRECRAGSRADRLIAFALACRKAETAPSSVLTRSLNALGVAQSMPRPQRDRLVRFGKRAHRPVVVTILGIGLAGFAWTRYIEIDPNVNFPAPAIQSPNAFDDFQKAGQLLREYKLIGEMLVPIQKQNPVDSSVSGSAGTGSVDAVPASTASKGTAQDERHVYTINEKQHLLSRNTAALKALREGLNKPYQAPPVLSFDQAQPYLSTDRSLARLLILEANTAADQDRWAASVQSGLDAVTLGAAIQQRGGTNAKLTGIACETIGRAPIWRAIDHLSSSEAHSALNRLQNISDNEFTLASTLVEQKWQTLSELQEMMRKPNWRLQWDRELTPKNLAMYLYLLPYSRTRILNNARTYLDKQLYWARGPYLPYNPYGLRGTNQALPSDKISELFIPDFDGVRFQDTVNRTENLLLITSLAVCAYHADHQGYPIGLSDLTPAYLKSLPIDPFSGTGKGFSYTLTKNGYIVYSVGPNGLDDHGVPIGDGTRFGNTNIQQDSNGDIVAGKNTS